MLCRGGMMPRRHEHGLSWLVVTLWQILPADGSTQSLLWAWNGSGFFRQDPLATRAPAANFHRATSPSSCLGNPAWSAPHAALQVGQTP